MKISYPLSIIILLITSVVLWKSTPIQENHIIKETESIPPDLTYLFTAYPGHFKFVTKNSLVWNDETMMIFDDGITNKDFNTLLNSPDLEDQMSIKYPIEHDDRIPFPMDYDPGRIRFEPFFKKMYGYNAQEVKKHLVPITWLPGSVNKKILITSINAVDKKLQAVSDELDKLPDDLKKYIDNPAGTFSFRKIAGTDRLSMHSFGIAIDINTKYSNYWKWDKPDSRGVYTYKNKIPYEIVNIFENHGFIWGGKWYHYDTMHFEYRPELLVNK